MKSDEWGGQMNGWTDQQTYKQPTDGQTDEWTDGWIDGGWTTRKK